MMPTPHRATIPAALAPAALRRLMSLMTGDAKHDESATSTLDVLAVLYGRVLRVSPDEPHDDERDRFLLSKGHGPMAYYAVLAACGFIPEAMLTTFGAFDSPLGGHPDRALVPGVEISSGSLGHGLPLAVGVALGLRARGRTRPHVVVLVGDGELDEGSNQEAIAYAAVARLDRLTAVVVDNRSAAHRVRPVGALFDLEGWTVHTVDGRDRHALERALTAPHEGAPLAVVAEVARR